ncbi:hypothetical protein EAO18_01435 [Klebsiella pneumoniae]|nr:hypothetical protein EAO18_01435 [Klebsiella pneumoniae]
MLTMTQVAKKILVTCALPYANGSIHLGHMLEHPADVWVRTSGARHDFMPTTPTAADYAQSAAARYHRSR